MGYDMSDSLFMQQQEAAGREKESKRALEERTALEAFRAAALKVKVSTSIHVVLYKPHPGYWSSTSTIVVWTALCRTAVEVNMGQITGLR